MLGTQTIVGKTPANFKVGKMVGLISDTHVPKRAHYIPKKVFEIFEKVDYIIHAGDLVELAVMDELEQLAPVLAVHGNMDGMDVSGALPRLNSLKVFNWKIGVMHDPNIIYGFNRMRDLVKQNEFNVFVYGHTHTASIKWEGKTLFINPGSPTDPSSSMQKPSVGLLKISPEVISPEIINI
jgi:putative phosphoesterase